MTYDEKQTIIEIKRKELIDIIEKEGCMVYNAIEFAIEEYILGLPCGEDSYFGFKEHFEKRCLKYEWSPSEWKYGNSMTEVLLHWAVSSRFYLLKLSFYCIQVLPPRSLWLATEFSAKLSR